MPKNIVVFSDGTGQEGGKGNNTNVYKIFNMIEDRTQHQVAFYDPGLGTGWRKITGNAVGAGMSRNICECYRFIFDHFEAGDQIFLFGFSRGAATVRSLSSFIHYFGILPKSRPELIKKAFKIYKTRDYDERKRKARDFLNHHHTMWTRIKVLGCYDTVAALGLPFKPLSALLDGIPGFRHRFHDFHLSQSIENAYHALALDDERKTFHPIPWRSDKLKDYQTIQQVWFCGAHTDVGGGYKEQRLSDIPLVWLLQKAHKNGLRIYPTHQVEIAEDALGVMHDSRGTLITKLYRKKVREWNPDQQGKPVVHQSVLDKAEVSKKHNGAAYHPWILDLEHEIEPWVRYADQPWHSDRLAEPHT